MDSDPQVGCCYQPEDVCRRRLKLAHLDLSLSYQTFPVISLPIGVMFGPDVYVVAGA